MTIKSFLKPVLLALCLLPLSSCSSLFKPKTMTIEYDEEVKLHDGEMIWAHITRHYGLVGGVPSGHGKSYMPSAVEISWDTGFEGVGRKSVYFDSYVGIIDKYDGKWYVAGNKNTTGKNLYKDSINCNSIGVFIEQLRCVVALNQQGEFVKAQPEDLYNINSKNIIYPMGIKDWGSIPRPLNNTKITWKDKLVLQSQQSKRFSDLNKPLLEEN
ncbi:hypothetical protein [Psychrobacter sp. TB55-MNA-CIBAN-0194]|uniref:hypothetical protein n=1 Tax=Psychrobacter sp. TB55-MNA-CIBAN-0194 TaxID=3140445 RepID=UPI00331C5FC4